MSFGWAGAGAGAGKALEQILAEQMIRAQLAQRQKEAAEQMALQTRQMEGLETERSEDRAFRGRQEARLAAQEQSQQSQQATDRNIGLDAANVLNMPGMTDEAKANEFRQSAIRNPNASSTPGMLKIVEGLTKAPKAPGTHVVAGNLVDDTGKVIFSAPKEPKAGEKPQIFNVGNGKLVDSTGKVIYDGGASPYAAERSARTSTAVDDIINEVSGWTAGYGGLAAGLPQTGARQLKGKLDTLRANIAFNELAAMREASKTGGALGSVAVRELDLLQNSLGNLDQLQDPAALVAELKKIKESAERWQQANGGAAKAAPMQPVPSGGGRRLRFDKSGKPIP